MVARQRWDRLARCRQERRITSMNLPSGTEGSTESSGAGDPSYVPAGDLAQARALLDAPGAVPLGGGTDLVPSIRERLVRPRALVDLARISDLRGIAWREDGSALIGAATTLAAIASDGRMRTAFPAVVRACELVGSPALRNMGTLGGNLCQRPRCWYFRQRLPCHKHGGSHCYAYHGENEHHAILGGGPCFIVHPSDTAVALMALGATLHVTGQRTGERAIAIEDFFVLPARRIDSENVLTDGEAIRAVELPALSSGKRQAFDKVTQRGAWDFAVVSVAWARRTDGSVRLVLGGVAPIPWRVTTSIEEDVASGTLGEDDVDTLAERALHDARPLAKNGYKVDLAGALLRRAIVDLNSP